MPTVWIRGPASVLGEVEVDVVSKVASNEPNPLDFMDVLPNPNLARPLRTRELLVKPTTFLF